MNAISFVAHIGRMSVADYERERAALREMNVRLDGMERRFARIETRLGLIEVST